MNVMLATLVGLFVLHSYLSQVYSMSSSLCGNEPKKKCAMRCYKNCTDEAAKLDIQDLDAKEETATRFNLCVNNCSGNAYKALMHSDIPDLPTYTDFQHCLGKCSYPAAKDYCIKGGYLSNFFSCDCHECCERNPATTNKDKCIFGCYLWFKRQFSPNPGEGCLFRPEYANSPKTYCRDYCIWLVLKLVPTLTVGDIPRLNMTAAAPCISVCQKFLFAGVHIDKKTRSDTCTDLTQCISVNLTRFRVFTDPNMTYEMMESAVKPALQIQLAANSVFSNTDSTVYVSRLKKWYRNVTNEFDIYRSPSLDSMHNLGLLTVHRLAGEPVELQYPSSIEIQFPWENVGPLLAAAYNYNVDTMRMKGKFKYLAAQIKFELEPCTRYRPEIYIHVSEMRIEHEAILKISDNTSLIPLNASELLSKIKQVQEWSDLTYVQDLDGHTIEMKAKGYAMVRFAFDIKLGGSDFAMTPDACSQIPGCDHPRTAGVTEFCRIRHRDSMREFNHGDLPPVRYG